MTSGSFIAFWVDSKPQRWKIALILAVVGTKLAEKGNNHTDAGLWERLGTHSHMEAFQRE